MGQRRGAGARSPTAQAPDGAARSLFSVEQRMEEMNLYRSLGNAIGTREAIELACRSTAWHDAMVVHQRHSGASPSQRCGADCPHAEAEALWREALDVYGDRAQQLGFLQIRGTSGQERIADAYLVV